MDQAFRIRPRYGNLFIGLMALLAILPALVVAVVGARFGIERRPELWAFVVLVPVFVAGCYLAARVFQGSARLVVNDQGMRMTTRTVGSFAVRWSEIAKASVLERLGILQIRRKGVGMPITLQLRDWVDEAEAVNAKAPRPARLADTPLYRALASHGLFAHPADAGIEAANFDLARHPATAIALGITGLLAAYWLLDTVFGREAWALWEAGYILPHAAVGFIAAVLGGLALGLARTPRSVPAMVVVTLALLLGLSAGLASWRGILRANQAFGGPLEPREYVRNASCDTLVPLDPGLPPIAYADAARDYWCRFPADHRHTVLVRRGIGGLYQVDLGAHTDAIRAHRRRQR